jgi:5-formyltetrahydrofolate cyclo-ligase
MTKQVIRNHYLTLRLALSDSEHNQLSQSLCNNFFASFDLSLISTVHIFLPIISKKEPDTRLIIDRLKAEFPHIRIAIPKINGETDIISYYFENNQQAKENKWGIPEPQYGEITPVEKIDLVIVPLLAFDLTGHRVGYGKGFYDRFLKQCKQDCKKIGFSFFDPVHKISDITSDDVILDTFITPSRFFKIN